MFLIGFRRAATAAVRLERIGFAAAPAALRRASSALPAPVVARLAAGNTHESLFAVTVPDVPLAEHIFSGFAALGNVPALIDGASGRALTYASLPGRVAAAAAGLAAAGVRAGDVVALVLPNSPEYFVAFIAVTSLGAINTTANPQYTASELAHQCVGSGRRVLQSGSACARLSITALLSVTPAPPGSRTPRPSG